MLYEDRTDAGRQLALRLEKLRGSDPVVLALARGGVVIGYEVARSLCAPLEVITARKLGAPVQPEFGFGAVGPGGVRVLDADSVRLLGLMPEQIEQIVGAETAEMERRDLRYRGGRERIDVAGRTAILVDDGLATGVTARAAVLAIRQWCPSRLILAVPVSPPDTAVALAREVDEMICLATPSDFRAVGQWYRDFDQTTDEEVIELLERVWQYLHAPAGGGADFQGD